MFMEKNKTSCERIFLQKISIRSQLVPRDARSPVMLASDAMHIRNFPSDGLRTFFHKW